MAVALPFVRGTLFALNLFSPPENMEMHMRLTKAILLMALTLFFFSAALPLTASAEKIPEVNTRGACLNVKEFVALIQHESRRMDSGRTLRLIADIPNEVEAREAIETVGYPIVEETRDEDRDFIDFLLEVKK